MLLVCQPRRALGSRVCQRGSHDVCAKAHVNNQLTRPEPFAQYLRLSEEIQTRYGFAEHPSCAPEAEGDSFGNTRQEIDALVQLLPSAMQPFLLGHDSKSELLEVVMDLGRTPLARFPFGDVEIADAPITQRDLDEAVARVGAFGTDNRAGINKTLHRVSCLRNRQRAIIGLTCRVGRSIPGSAAMIADLAISGCSILLLGSPGMGKTTAIREMSRTLADSVGKRVVICDTSNEIGGDGDVPHPGIGRARRMQVFSADKQHEVMIEAVENHMPQVVVIDEIGTEAETQAARTISQRGVQLIATAHGMELEYLVKNPSLVDLVSGIGSVTLGDDEAKRRGGQKSVLERTGLPTFDVCVEMLSRREWCIWEDVGIVVDRMLLGKEPPRQIRTRCPDGRVIISRERFTPSSLVARQASLDKAAEAKAAAGAADASPSSPSPMVEDQAIASSSLRTVGDAAADTSTGLPLLTRSAFDVTSPGFPASQRRSSRPIGSSRQARPTFPDDPFHGWDSIGEPLEGPAYDRLDFQLAEQQALDSSDGEDGSGSDEEGGARASGVRVFLYGVQGTLVRQAASAVDPNARVRLVTHIKDADLVMSTRVKMRTGTGRSVRADAKGVGVPVLSLKASSLSECVRALRCVLGLDPSPGLTLTSSSAPDLADPNYGARVK